MKSQLHNNANLVAHQIQRQIPICLFINKIVPCEKSKKQYKNKDTILRDNFGFVVPDLVVGSGEQDTNSFNLV